MATRFPGKKQMKEISTFTEEKIARLSNLESFAYQEMIRVNAEMKNHKAILKDIKILKQKVRGLSRINKELNSNVNVLLASYNRLLKRHLDFVRGYEKLRLIFKQEIEKNRKVN